jgi:hypothetical protein
MITCGWFLHDLRLLDVYRRLLDVYRSRFVVMRTA